MCVYHSACHKIGTEQNVIWIKFSSNTVCESCMHINTKKIWMYGKWSLFFWVCGHLFSGRKKDNKILKIYTKMLALRWIDIRSHLPTNERISEDWISKICTAHSSRISLVITNSTYQIKFGIIFFLVHLNDDDDTQQLRMYLNEIYEWLLNPTLCECVCANHVM